MATFILLISLLTHLPLQAAKAAQPTIESVTQEADGSSSNCSQDAAVQEPLIREAVENQYWVRWVAFAGNEHTRDRVLRRRILLQEGDVFTRESLLLSLERVSKLKKIIYPVNLSDVIITLDRPNKIVDMTICFKEKRGH